MTWTSVDFIVRYHPDGADPRYSDRLFFWDPVGNLYFNNLPGCPAMAHFQVEIVRRGLRLTDATVWVRPDHVFGVAGERYYFCGMEEYFHFNEEDHLTGMVTLELLPEFFQPGDVIRICWDGINRCQRERVRTDILGAVFSTADSFADWIMETWREFSQKNNIEEPCIRELVFLHSEDHWEEDAFRFLDPRKIAETNELCSRWRMHVRDEMHELFRGRAALVSISRVILCQR